MRSAALTLPVPMLAALLTACDGRGTLTPPEEITPWRCADLLVETRLQDATLLLDVPGGRYRLVPAASASGARYTTDDGTAFWSKGEDRALLSYDGTDNIECSRSERRSPWAQAAEMGTRLRASGQEPGWLAKVSKGDTPSIYLLLDYGERETRLEYSEPLRGADKGFRALGAAITLRYTETPCRDSMSGHPFPLSVELTVDGKVYRGCGRNYDSDD